MGCLLFRIKVWSQNALLHLLQSGTGRLACLLHASSVPCMCSPPGPPGRPHTPTTTVPPCPPVTQTSRQTGPRPGGPQPLRHLRASRPQPRRQSAAGTPPLAGWMLGQPEGDPRLVLHGGPGSVAQGGLYSVPRQPALGSWACNSAAAVQWPQPTQAVRAAGMWMRCWPTWRRCASNWGWRNGRCWVDRGVPWWRWPMCKSTPRPSARWCCAAVSGPLCRCVALAEHGRPGVAHAGKP